MSIYKDRRKNRKRIRTQRVTGRPKGAPPGSNNGGGRPKGVPNLFPMGAVKAMAALSLRVPADAPEEAKELADRALQRVAAVMDGKVHASVAVSVLKAATHIREEICGPLTKRIEVDAKVGLSALLDQVSEAEKKLVTPAVPTLPPSVPKAPMVRKASGEVIPLMVKEASEADEE